MTETFISLLEKRVQDSSSLICIGLEPHIRNLPNPSAASAQDFCLNLVKQTAPYTAAFTLNPAHFEIFGVEYWAVLKQVVDAIHSESARLGSVIPIILDARRSDTGSAAEAYVKSAFEDLGVHCITLNPYLGKDSIEPFIRNLERGVFLLSKTSNSGSMDIQNVLVLPTGSDSPMPLYMYIAFLAQEWNVNHNIGIVVDAAHPKIMSMIRAGVPDLWFLSSGVDTQGGELELALKAGLRADGKGMLIHVSSNIVRGIDTPAKAAKDLRDKILKITHCAPYG
jgi:orotidine 5'-phosphate decarboxylase subfamily 2